MALFAIADLHLGFGVSKPMSVFGAHWDNHAQLIATHWQTGITPEDTVLVPGDISWGINLEEALPDLSWLDRLPGRKILIQGNHDYWWTSLAKVEALCQTYDLRSLHFLRNKSIMAPDGVLICGTRGWLLPNDPDFGTADEKIYLREVGRLKLSLEDAARRRTSGQNLIACMHYPPFDRNGAPSLFTELLSAFSVDLCVYGHIHGLDQSAKRPEPSGQVRYSLVAADYLAFRPAKIFPCAGNGLVI